MNINHETTLNLNNQSNILICENSTTKAPTNSQIQIYNKRKLKKKSDTLWLTTFADLSFILMSFFALLFSFSTLDKQKFENVKEGMLAKSPIEIKNKSIVEKKKNNLKTISQELQKQIDINKIDATVIFDAEGVRIELNDKLFFASGSAEISYQYKEITNKVLQIVAQSPKHYHIILEGHTDDVPLGTKAKYSSNWDLSAARAISMLKELKQFGVSEHRMAIAAYAHTKPRVPYQNKTGKELEQARNANRRVVIKIQ